MCVYMEGRGIGGGEGWGRWGEEDGRWRGKMVGLQVIDLSTPDGGIRNLLLANQSDSEFSMSGVGGIRQGVFCIFILF
jgi:hypothetical protein